MIQQHSVSIFCPWLLAHRVSLGRRKSLLTSFLHWKVFVYFSFVLQLEPRTFHVLTSICHWATPLAWHWIFEKPQFFVKSLSDSHGGGGGQQAKPQAVWATGLITANPSTALCYFCSALEPQHTKCIHLHPPTEKLTSALSPSGFLLSVPT